MYNDNIHYLKDGKYLDIDNALKETKNYYENIENSFKVKFNKEDHEININESDFAFKIKGNACKIKKQAEKIIYENILNNINTSYNLTACKLRGNIELKNKDAINEEIIFEIKTNLNLVQEEDGSIKAYNKKKKSIK